VKENRIESIDIFRGLGIIIMIMGHIDFGETFSIFIHAFHMPMFYFISGMFFNREKVQVTKKIRTLLLPYLFFAIMHYGVWLYWNRGLEWNIKLRPLKIIFWQNTNNIPIAGALWFLTSLFFTEMIYLLLVRFVKNAILFNVIVVMIVLVGNLELNIFGTQLPFALGTAFVGVGLFHLGQMTVMYKNNNLVKKALDMNWLGLILLTFITIVLIFYNDEVNMRASEYRVIPLFWINAVSCIFIGLNISKKLDLILPTKLKNMVTYIGRNSIVYVCLNQLVIVLLYGFYVDSLPIKLVYLLVVLICLRGINFIIDNTLLKRIIGR
jgi:fucose 4-O-acetylase-like acetyltransferase